jgi:hypothetical protein
MLLEPEVVPALMASTRICPIRPRADVLTNLG